VVAVGEECIMETGMGGTPGAGEVEVVIGAGVGDERCSFIPKHGLILSSLHFLKKLHELANVRPHHMTSIHNLYLETPTHQN
jgi:hypothetical protein